MSTEDPIVVYCMPGSQFSFKVLAALQANKVPHFVHFVPVDPEARRRVLPSGGTMVPEVKVGTGDSPIVIPDSEAILQWLAENRNLAHLYPTPDCHTLSVRASSKTLAGMVWYYNWVDEKGCAASMLKSGRRLLPSYVFPNLLPDAVLRLLFAGTRAKYQELAAQALETPETELAEPSSEPRLRARLVEELQFFQSLLVQPHTEQPYLIADAKQPTAVDFSVYSQLERLVGEGTVSDVVVDPAIQEFKTEPHGLERLWEWYNHMREQYPVQFKGKRAPPELLVKQQ